jgi:hypothetical protein
MRKRGSRLLILVAVLLGAGCYDSGAQRSAIVRYVEANGSGDLSTVTPDGIRQWFSVRPVLATKIAEMCQPLFSASQADWPHSAEGSVCFAARWAAPIPLIKADPRVW